MKRKNNCRILGDDWISKYFTINLWITHFTVMHHRITMRISVIESTSTLDWLIHTGNLQFYVCFRGKGVYVVKYILPIYFSIISVWCLGLYVSYIVILLLLLLFLLLLLLLILILLLYYCHYYYNDFTVVLISRLCQVCI